MRSDLAGQRFGRPVAVEPTDERKGGSVVWRCRCDCGNECLAIVAWGPLGWEPVAFAEEAVLTGEHATGFLAMARELALLERAGREACGEGWRVSDYEPASGWNLPPGCFENDPRAPWNEPDPWVGHACGECALCGEVVRGAETEAACFLLAGEMQVEAVDGDGEACEEWRAA